MQAIGLKRQTRTRYVAKKWTLILQILLFYYNSIQAIKLRQLAKNMPVQFT